MIYDLRFRGIRGGKRFPILAALALSLAGIASWSRAAVLGDDFQPWDTVEGRDGNFYGKMFERNIVPGGSVYSLTPEGSLKRVHRFAGNSGAPSRSGQFPERGFGIGQDGAIYGSTYSGGVFGNGVLFKIDPPTGYKVLHHFSTYSPFKGSLVAAENGDLFVIYAEYLTSHVLRLSKDGSQTMIPIRIVEYPMTLVENANHEIILGTYTSGFSETTGTLWRLNSNDEFERLAEVGYYPHHLIPLPDGSLLCLTSNRLLRVFNSGEVSVVHEFTVPYEGLQPNFVVVAKDGSYIGSTLSGGLEYWGTVFRIVPESNAFTILSHLSPPGIRGQGVRWMEKAFPLLAAAEAGNRPPMAKDDFIAATSLETGIDGFPQTVIPVLKNDSDADEDPLTIISVSAAAHGVAAFDFVSQSITYRANSTEVENDTFTYTIVDGSGGRATGRVFIRTNAAGRYTGDVSSPENPASGDPGTTVGELSIIVYANRNAVCRLELLGKTYRFTGHFNQMNQFGAVLESKPRLGQSTGIQLGLRPDGPGWTIEATIRKNGLPFSGVGTKGP
jgi:uncharacterized repeat protein (TIGR03803 family)